MTGTTNLALPYIAANQAAKEVTHKADLDQIDARFDSRLTKSLSSGNGTVSLAELQACWLISATGAAVARDLTLAAFIGGRTIENTGSHSISIKVGSTTLILPASSVCVVRGDGTADGIGFVIPPLGLTSADFVGDSGSGGTAGLVPAPAPGDAAAGKFCSAAGGWAVPGGGSGGGLVFVGADVVSGTPSSLAVTGLDDTFDEFDLVISNLNAATDDGLIIQFGTGGGPSWVTSGYKLILIGADTSPSGPSRFTEGSASGLMGSADLISVSATAGRALNMSLRLAGLRSASSWKSASILSLYSPSGANSQMFAGFGVLENATKITAVRVMTGSANLAGGAIRVYGLAKS